MNTPPHLEFLSWHITLYESGKVSLDAMRLKSLVSVMMRICGRSVSMRPASSSFFPFKLLVFVITVLMKSGYRLGFLRSTSFGTTPYLAGVLLTLHFPLTLFSLMGGTFGIVAMELWAGGTMPDRALVCLKCGMLCIRQATTACMPPLVTCVALYHRLIVTYFLRALGSRAVQVGRAATMVSFPQLYMGPGFG